MRGYDDSTHLIWYPSPDVRSGTPAVPDPWSKGCATGQEAGIAGPTWSPDGTALALESADGIWVKRQARDCTVQPTLAIAGGSAPDWGPANVNPAPRPTGGGNPGGGGKPAGGGVGTPGGGERSGDEASAEAGSPSARCPRRRRCASARPSWPRRCAPASRSRCAARSPAAGRSSPSAASASSPAAPRRFAADGTATVTLRFTKAGKRALRGARSVKLAISGGGAKAAVTLKR